MFFCLESEGSNGSLFSNGWFQCFPVQKIVHYKTPPWKDQPVLPFLSEAAAGTNITSHQVIIISQITLRC